MSTAEHSQDFTDYDREFHASRSAGDFLQNEKKFALLMKKGKEKNRADSCYSVCNAVIVMTKDAQSAVLDVDQKHFIHEILGSAVIPDYQRIFQVSTYLLQLQTTQSMNAMRTQASPVEQIRENHGNDLKKFL